MEGILTVETLAIFPYRLPTAFIAFLIIFNHTYLLNRIRAFTLWKEYENEQTNTCINKKDIQEADHTALLNLLWVTEQISSCTVVFVQNSINNTQFCFPHSPPVSLLWNLLYFRCCLWFPWHKSMICVPFNLAHVKILIAPCHMSVDDNCIDPPCSGLSKGTVLITE